MLVGRVDFPVVGPQQVGVVGLGEGLLLVVGAGGERQGTYKREKDGYHHS